MSNSDYFATMTHVEFSHLGRYPNNIRQEFVCQIKSDIVAYMSSFHLEKRKNGDESSEPETPHRDFPPLSLPYHAQGLRCIKKRALFFEKSHTNSPNSRSRLLTFPCFFPINEGLQKWSWSDNEWRGGSDG